MRSYKSITFVIITISIFVIIIDILFNFLKIPPRKWSKYNDIYGTYGWYTWHGANHIDGDHKLQTNSFQTRGKKPTKKDRIILLGDSAVETSHEFEKMPENYLEKYLPSFSVISFGSWGWGNDQQLLHLKNNIKKIKPKKVVLWFQANDIDDNFNKIGFLGPKPTFKIVNNKLIYPKEKMGDKTIYPVLYQSYFYRILKHFKINIKKVLN